MTLVCVAESVQRASLGIFDAASEQFEVKFTLSRTWSEDVILARAILEH